MGGEKAINKLVEIDEQRKELEMQSAETKELLRNERAMQEITERIAHLEMVRRELLSVDADESASPKKKYEAAVKAEQIESELAGLKNRQKEIQKAISGLSYIVQNKKNFDKTRVFRNIRELLKIKDVKLGQMEKDAGTQPGYMSRLEREGNTSDPSIEFLVTAAKSLGISLDTLINGTVGEISPTEEYLLKFLRNVVDDTRDDTINWKRDSLAVLDQIVVTDFSRRETSHPLFTFRVEEDPYQGHVEVVYYNSRFFPAEEIAPGGDCYEADLPDTSSKIFLMNCVDGNNRSFYEVYLVNQSVMPVCCSLQSCGEVATMLDNLYKEIELSSRRVHLNSEAKDIISQYLTLRDLPFK